MSAQSLADGPAGAALLAAERGQDPRPWLARMVADPVMAHPDEVGLFEGAPAVAFTFAAIGRTHELSTLDPHVEAITRTRLHSAHQRMDTGVLPVKREFDLISGLTGLGAYLLHRRGDGEPLRDVLAYLVRLTQPRPDGLPGWWTQDGPTGPAPGWEGGHGNIGMAHGITGPLVLLALAARQGVAVDGQADAMRRICAWLDEFRCGTLPRIWWPEAITCAQHHDRTAPEDGPYRPSWCYGVPGVAYGQLLAGLALEDGQRQRLALDALASCVSDDVQLSRLRDVSLCHGWAGLLYIAWRASPYDDRIRTEVPRLLGELTSALGHRPPPTAGLLTGEDGVLLARHAVTFRRSPITQWDACLLLNEERER